MNRLLRTLPATDAAMLVPLLSRTRLTPLQQVSAAKGQTARMVFPDTATITLSLPHAEAAGLAIGIVGREGMIGWPVLLGQPCAPFDAAAGLEGGTAYFIETAAFVRVCAASPSLQALILCFAQAMAAQFASAAACAMQDSVGRRLARWLLMLHDRQDGDELALTHDTLALDLGIRRASVTDCLHLLEGDHIVRCTRGRIVVRDRAALEDAAGAAYGLAEAEYGALIAPFAKSGNRLAAIPAIVERDMMTMV